MSKRHHQHVSEISAPTLAYSNVLQQSLQRQRQQALRLWQSMVPAPNTLSLQMVTTDLTRSLQALGVFEQLLHPDT